MKYSDKIEQIIKITMQDGFLDETEEKVLRKAAESEGIDPDLLIIDVKARLDKKKSPNKISQISQWIKEGEKTSSDGTTSNDRLVFFVIGIFFIVSFIGLGVCDIFEEKTLSLDETLQNQDFEAAQKIVNEEYEHYNKYKNSQYFSRYNIAYSKYFRAVSEFLVLENSEEANKRIINTLHTYVIVGNKPDKGLLQRPTGGLFDNSDEVDNMFLSKYEDYIESVKTYNSNCKAVLDLAITSKNEQLAKSVLQLFKENIKITLGRSKYTSDYSKKNATVKVNGVAVDDEHAYVEYLSTDINEAKTVYNLAKKEGKFKK